MIGILQNKKLNNERMVKIAEWHWNAVKTLLDKMRVELTYNRTLEQLYKVLGCISLEQVIKATPNELIDMCSILPHNDLKKFTLKKNKTHLLCHMYESYRKKYGAELVKRLEISVCPYCNRNFINSNGDKTPAQFDHFLSKNDYPIFALSLYNLIPCCNTCNQWKGTKRFTISPYDSQYTTDKLLYFSYIPLGDSDYKIEIKAIDSKIDVNISQLQLRERYSVHTDLLKELIIRQKYYRPCNRKFWDELVRENGLPDGMSFDEFFYGNYLTEDKYYLRPLSKFTHDIIEELEKSKISN